VIWGLIGNILMLLGGVGILLVFLTLLLRVEQHSKDMSKKLSKIIEILEKDKKTEKKSTDDSG
jgi:Na+-transporting methylmalonyl-CoA/oxaloacetate decarboxylase gamma subunit